MKHPILTTRSEVIEFLAERSPHVRQVKIREVDDYVVEIRIKLHFWYGLFYSRIFLKFIEKQITDRAMLGFEYKVIVE